MNWLLFPFRLLYTIYGFLTFLLITIVGVSIILIQHYSGFGDIDHKAFPVLIKMSNLWLFLNAIQLEVKGKEHLRLNESFMIVGNHSSTLDMFTCTSGVPFRFRALGKAELNDIPVVRILFRTVTFFIDRSNPESRARGVAYCRKEIKNGHSIFIMPEGTRNRTKSPLLPFKEGAFRLAIETQTDIQPFVLLHCRNIYPMWSWVMLRPGKIVLQFLPPVSTKHLTLEDTSKLTKSVHQMMEEVILREDDYYQQQKNQTTMF